MPHLVNNSREKFPPLPFYRSNKQNNSIINFRRWFWKKSNLELAVFPVALECSLTKEVKHNHTPAVLA